MKKLTIIIGIFVLAGIVLGNFISRNGTENAIIESPKKVLSERSNTEKSVQPGIPKTLSIPSINVTDVPVEQVGLDSEKRMDVPKNVYNTGWYMYGPRPGEKGNAAIDGHLDTPSGAPSVFYNLTKLTEGDEIIVTDENGKDFTFAITEIATYETQDFPLDEVFGDHAHARLNLITCEGTFDRNTKDYSQRTVVYSELVTE